MARGKAMAAGILGGVLAIALCLMAVPAVTPRAAGAVDLTQAEAEMFRLVNQAREEAGVAPLFAEERLTVMARDYCAEMIEYDFFSHVSPVSGDLQQRIDAHGITGWCLAGENICKSPTVEAAFSALMNSPSHRENILRPQFNCIGIGILQGPNGLVITQEFMQFDPLPPTAWMPGEEEPAPQPLPSGGNLFDTWILVMNPGEAPASLTVTFQDESGAEQSFQYTVGAFTRFTLPARETIGLNAAFATRIQSDRPVLAERAMYFDYACRDGGHDTIGATAPSREWYFAEGYTGCGFDTWILLQNPGAEAARARLEFMREDGAVITWPVEMAARSRRSVHVNEIPGLEGCSVSTRVSSDRPLAAERAMYFDYGGRLDGHNTIGATAPSREWYFAEGYTGCGFDTWILLQNPGAEAARARLEFMREDGAVVPLDVDVPPRSRRTVKVNDVPGVSGCSVSTRVSSDRPLAAERAMYFDYRGRGGGHDSIGAQQPSTTWYFAEGSVQ